MTDVVQKLWGFCHTLRHDGVDYGLIASHGRLIVDTRNVFARLGLTNARVVKA
jgi:hypothetical protein